MKGPYVKSNNLAKKPKKHKKLQFLPSGVFLSITFKKDRNRVQVQFRVSYWNDEHHDVLRLHLGRVCDITEEQFIFAQNCAATIRQIAKNCYYADEFFDVTLYQNGKWREMTPTVRFKPKGFSYVSYVLEQEKRMIEGLSKDSERDNKNTYKPRKRYFTNT